MVYPGETSEEARKRVWDEARSSWLALDKESMEAGFDVALLPFLQFEVRCLNFELRTASKIVSFQVGVGFWHWGWLIANLPFQSMSQTRFQKPTPLTLGGKHVQSSLKIEFEVRNSKIVFVLLIVQAKKRRAVLANTMAKTSVVQVPDPEDNENAANAVVNANAALEFPCCPDLAAGHLSDPHFAVSEQLVDEARAKHIQSGGQKSWLETSYEVLKQQHGHMQGTSGDTVQLPMQEEEDEDEDGVEENLCEYGFCQTKQSRQYAQNCHRLFEQVKNLLRQCRDSRKKNGFMPNHIVLLWCRGEMIIDLALLIRVMFRPFDGTAILLERCPNDSAIAKVKVKDDGMLDFFPCRDCLASMPSLTMMWC